MSQNKSTLFRMKFIDLYKVSMSELYHIVTINGRTACSGLSTADGHSVWINRPAGTRVNVSIKDPRSGKMTIVKKDLIVPLIKTTIEIQAPFAKHKIKLNMFEGEVGDYWRKTHKVQRGETLSSIAKTHGLTWTQIAQLNNLKDPYVIRVGDILKLPPKSTRQQHTSQTSSRSATITQSKDTYEVKKGDTLSDISQKSGVSVSELQRINGITDPKKLQYGQSIKLRERSSSSSNAESTPSTSSEETGFFDGIQNAIADAAENIREGFEDFNNAISGTREGESADSPRPFENQSSTNQSIYIVKSGDTLSKIAEQHGISLNDLVKENNLNVNEYIFSGQKLKIPNKKSNNTSSVSSTNQNDIEHTLLSQPVQTEVSDTRGQSGTPKVNVTKLGDCSCNRDLTLDELEDMIRQLSGKNEIILFNDDKCTLNTIERNTQNLLTELNKVFNKYDINTCIRRIHFLAQAYHESAGFTTTTEFSNGNKYNPGRHDDAIENGNTVMGDGPKYRGRGLMQLTWKNNYKYYKAFSGTDVVTNYRLVSTSLAIGADAAGWFWKQGKVLSKGKRWKGPKDIYKPNFIKDEDIDYPKTKVSAAGLTYHTIDMNLIADKDVVDLISYLINGGENGENDRRKNVTILKKFFKYPSKCVSTGISEPITESNILNSSGGYIILVDGEMSEVPSKRLLEARGKLSIYKGNTLEVSINAIHGGFGKGAPPNGEYETYHYRNRSKGYGDYNHRMCLNGVGFSFNLEPKFTTNRSLLRIHPDGNTTGTLGCVGLVGTADELKEVRDKINEILTIQNRIDTTVNITGNPNNHG